MTDIIKNVFPSYFPTVTNESLQKWVDTVEQLFKQPIKQVFPYPIDIKKVYSNNSGKLVKIVFDVALAGIDKHDISVQLKKKKYLCIKIENKSLELVDESVEYVYSSRALTHKNGEITFKILDDIDLSKFKPTFINGLLEIELYVKEQQKDDDVITANIE